MDPRIKKAIRKAVDKKQRALEEEHQKKVEREAERVRHIASYAAKADLWVKQNIFDQIGEAVAAGSDRIYLAGVRLSPTSSETSSDYIPSEALAKAVEKIDGLSIEKRWNEGSTDWEYPVEPYMEYYVKWGNQ